MMTEKRYRVLVFLLFLGSLAVRLFPLDWDQGHHFHPDERRIVEAIQHITFKPLQLNPDFFAYGSFPFYLTRVMTSVLSRAEEWFASYDGTFVVGRALSALWGAGTVVLLVVVGRRLYGARTGLLAGLLLTSTVLHVQQSHFAVNDVPLTFLVLAVLLLLVLAVDSGRALHFALSGMVAGLAIATKVSALPVLLPVAIAVVLRARAEGRLAAVLRLAAVTAPPCAIAFVLGEPYAVLGWERFLRDVREQSEMVRTAGLFAYTNQYVGVTKYLHDLREMVLWGMGPALGLAAVWGTIRRVGANLRAPRWEEWILLSWVLPFFAITGYFEVKFIRYLLPIYPMLVLWAAHWMEDIAKRGLFGRLARVGVVTLTAGYLLGFVSIYLRPFTVVAASEWFYQHIPPATRVLTQDWDEGFPLPRPGHSGEAYSVVPFGYYEPDSTEKMARLAQEISAADLVVLQTRRIYGAVSQAETKFPLTNRYFRLLFAGDLGYRLERDFTSRPGLFGVSLPTELADESFSIYDHPRVLIFRNTERFTAEELERRILTAVPSENLSRSDLLTAQADHTTRVEESLRSSLPALLLVALLLQLSGLATYALLLVAGWPRIGLYALAKPLGALAFAWPVWVAASLGLAPFSRTTLGVWVAILAVAGAFAWRRRSGERPSRWEIGSCEIASWGAFLIFLGLRAANPEVYWGEKPMDFSFLNSLYRTTTLPSVEPWFAGSSLSYTYFGHFLVAAIGKCLDIHPAIMFNLGIGVVAALTAAALVAAGTLLTNAWRAGVMTAALTLLVGNLSVIRELPSRRALSFDYFWATSRVIPNTINEFPFWSLAFADLHAHLLAMPFAFTFVALLLVWRERSATGWVTRLTLLGVAGLTLGAIAVTSAWSVPTYVGVLVALLALGWFTAGGQRSFSAWAGSGLAQVVAPSAVVLGAAWLSFLPFWIEFTPPPRNWGWERGPHASPVDFLLIFGGFLLVLVPFLLLAWRRHLGDLDQPLSRLQRIATSGLGVGLLLALLNLRSLAHGDIRPAASVGPFAFALGLVALTLAWARSTGAGSRVPFALGGLALLLTAAGEVVYLWDRMNTVFKLYLDAWYLLALASGYAMWQLIGGELRQHSWRTPLRLTAFAAALVGLATSATGAWGLVTHRHATGPRPTLNGTAYLASHDPDALEAYEWINRCIPGTPVLCEAYGPAYQQYARVSMNTGLPSLLGWDYHVFQRGHSWDRIEGRKRDIATIYSDPDPNRVAPVLAREQVSLVYVGPLEEHTYGSGIRERFLGWSDLLTPVFQNRQVTVFTVRGAPMLVSPDLVVHHQPELGEDSDTEPSQDPLGVLRQPRGVATDPMGNVWVCDFGNDRVQKLGPDLEPLAAWGRRGTGEGEFNQPCAIAVGAGSTVYVADTWNGRVQLLDPDGRFIRQLGGNLYGPRGVAVSSDGSVFVSDTGNNRVVRFGANGDVLGTWGSEGRASDRLKGPVGIAVDHEGRVVVCDNGNGQLRLYSADGDFLRSFPVDGWRDEAFSEPQVTVDREGTLWVSVPLEGEVRAYAPDGRVLRRVRLRDDDPRPCGVALRPGDNRLVITDIGHNVIGEVEIPPLPPVR